MYLADASVPSGALLQDENIRLPSRMEGNALPRFSKVLTEAEVKGDPPVLRKPVCRVAGNSNDVSTQPLNRTSSTDLRQNLLLLSPGDRLMPPPSSSNIPGMATRVVTKISEDR